jgi:flagellin
VSKEDNMRINTNISALTAYKNLFDVQSKLSTVQEQLSSGLRINSAKDDPAGASMASRLSVRSDSLATAQDNIGTAQNLLSVATGGLGGIEDLVKEMRTLALQSADGSLSSTERSSLVAQIQQINSEIDDIVLETTWNGQTMLDGTADYSFQTGANSSNFTTWQLTTAFDSTSLYIQQNSSAGATVAWTTPTIADSTAIETGTWQIEFQDTTTFTYTTASGTTGQGTTDSTVTAEGLTFTVAGNANYVAGDLLTFDTTASTDRSVTIDTTNSATGLGQTSIRYAGTSLTEYAKFDEAGTLTFTKTSASTAAINTASGLAASTTFTVVANNENNIWLDSTAIKLAGATAGAGTVTWTLTGTAEYAHAAIIAGATQNKTAAGTVTIDLDGDGAADVSVGIDGTSEAIALNDAFTLNLNAGTVTASGAYYGDTAFSAAASSTTGYATYGISIDGVGGDDEFSLDVTEGLANGEKLVFNITKYEAASVDTAVNDDGVIGNAVDLSTANGARASLYRIDTALSSVRATTSTVGALSRRMGFKMDALAVSETNTRAALSRIQDADMAKVQLESVQLQILQQTSLSMLSQAMYLPQSVLSLFGGK